MIFGLDVVMKLDDVGMVEFGKDTSFIDNFFFPGFLNPFNSNEIELPLLSGLEDNWVFALRLLLIEVIVIHNLNSNYNLQIIIIPLYITPHLFYHHFIPTSFSTPLLYSPIFFHIPPSFIPSHLSLTSTPLPLPPLSPYSINPIIYIQLY